MKNGRASWKESVLYDNVFESKFRIDPEDVDATEIVTDVIDGEIA